VDKLKNDGRLDLEQLEISCRKGVVYLEGIIPSEIEHQILLRTLTDVMGFSSLIDRIQINEPDWQRNDGVQCGELDDVSAQRPHPIT
jgi:hypothetical protein